MKLLPLVSFGYACLQWHETDGWLRGAARISTWPWGIEAAGKRATQTKHKTPVTVAFFGENIFGCFKVFLLLSFIYLLLGNGTRNMMWLWYDVNIQYCGILIISGLFLGLQPPNEWRRYKVTPSVISWAIISPAILSDGYEFLEKCCDSFVKNDNFPLARVFLLLHTLLGFSVH